MVFLGGAEASASPSFALPMFITIKKIIIRHLILGVPAATVGGTGTPVATPLVWRRAEIALGLVLYRVPCQCRALAWPFFVINRKVCSAEL